MPPFPPKYILKFFKSNIFIYIYIYSGVCLYRSKTLDHAWVVKGGKVPKIGRQLTIERPELVKRVKPPIIMIAKTIIVRIISQTNILILKLLFLFLEFIKGI